MERIETRRLHLSSSLFLTPLTGRSSGLCAQQLRDTYTAEFTLITDTRTASLTHLSLGTLPTSVSVCV